MSSKLEEHNGQSLRWVIFVVAVGKRFSLAKYNKKGMTQTTFVASLFDLKHTSLTMIMDDCRPGFESTRAQSSFACGG